MSFIATVPVQDAEGDVRAMYEQFEQHWGYVPNHAKIFSHRPAVQQAWHGLFRAVSANLDARRYELATVAAARGLRNTYCMLAHGSRLLDQEFDAEQLTAIAADHTTADLSPAEKAIMSYAEKVARDAASVTADDIQQLRRHGLSDAEIFDVAATAAQRCFFATLLDAVGAQADSVYLDLDEKLRQSLTIGRTVSRAQVEHIS